MNELTLSDVEVAINKAFERWTPRIIEECTRNNQLFQAQCDAHRVFSDKENIRIFFNTKGDLDKHIDMHETNEVKTEKRQRIIVKVLTSSLVLQAIWNLLQWKHH